VSLSGYSQSYHCLFKQNEFAKWTPAEVDITILTGDTPASNVIQVQEAEGILLTILYDQISEFEGCTYYTYKNGIRMVVPIKVPDTSRRILTVLSNNYICPENN